MKNEIKNLSENAIRLYDILLQSGGAWEGTLRVQMFPPPAYASNPEAQRAYWQYDANINGVSNERPVGSQSEIFNPNVEVPYSRAIMAAYAELKNIGLAGERNSGFNDYYLFPIKK